MKDITNLSVPFLGLVHFSTMKNFWSGLSSPLLTIKTNGEVHGWQFSDLKSLTMNLMPEGLSGWGF